MLRFANRTTLLNGASAEMVIGQADFTSGSANRGGTPTANTLSVPRGLFVDSGGRLWVDDSGSLWVGEFRNHRVTRFDNAALKNLEDPADGVLGQPGFNSNVSGSSAASWPNRVAQILTRRIPGA